MIYDNMIRTIAPQTLTQTLYLNYVVPNKAAAAQSTDSHSFGIVLKCEKYRDLALRYIDKNSLVTDSDYKSCQYLCYISDRDIIARERREYSQIKAFEYVLENAIGHDGYINNVLDVFEQNPRVGILKIKQPYCSELFELLGEHCGKDGECFTSAYWVRSELTTHATGLDSLVTMTDIAREKRYLVGEIINELCAATRLVDYEHMLADLLGDVSGQTYLANLQKRIYQRIKRNIHYFFWDSSARSRRNYLYGCGVFGKAIAKHLLESGIAIESFVVSDDVCIAKLNMEDLSGIPVQHISAILAQKDNCNLFICADKKLFGTLYGNAKALGFAHLVDVLSE
jgi:hypothetical protein